MKCVCAILCISILLTVSGCSEERMIARQEANKKGSKAVEELLSMDKKIVCLGSVPYDYYTDSAFFLEDYWENVDSIVYLHAKSRSTNALDTSAIIEIEDDVLSIPTDVGHISYKVKPHDEHGHEFEDYEHEGHYKSLDAHVVSFMHSGGFGFDLILISNGEVLCFFDFPHVSDNNQLIVTCRTDADNVALGTIKFYALSDRELKPLWGGWSDHTLLPMEAVWESDSTVLIKAEEYEAESDFHKGEDVDIIYGRLTMQHY
ncbi:MAG: hypothetical protein ACK5IQ_07205 [Bacteroidales bacterium]